MSGNYPTANSGSVEVKSNLQNAIAAEYNDNKGKQKGGGQCSEHESDSGSKNRIADHNIKFIYI